MSGSKLASSPGHVIYVRDFLAGVGPDVPWHAFRLLPEYKMRQEDYPSVAAGGAQVDTYIEVGRILRHGRTIHAVLVLEAKRAGDGGGAGAAVREFTLPRLLHAPADALRALETDGAGHHALRADRTVAALARDPGRLVRVVVTGWRVVHGWRIPGAGRAQRRRDAAQASRASGSSMIR